MLAEIDAVCGGNRSEWLRCAIRGALDGGVEPVVDRGAVSEPVSADPGVGARLHPKSAELLEFIRGKRLSSRDAERRLGWSGLLFHRAEAELLRLRLARMDAGLLRASDEVAG